MLLIQTFLLETMISYLCIIWLALNSLILGNCISLILNAASIHYDSHFINVEPLRPITCLNYLTTSNLYFILLSLELSKKKESFSSITKKLLIIYYLLLASFQLMLKFFSSIYMIDWLMKLFKLHYSPIFLMMSLNLSWSLYTRYSDFPKIITVYYSRVLIIIANAEHNNDLPLPMPKLIKMNCWDKF